HTVNLTVFDEIVVQIDKVDASCFGSADGSAAATASGGTGNFLYTWSNGTNGPTASGLAAGTYSVTVIDDSGCIQEASVTITQPDAVEVSIVAQNVSCDELGSATATATGGTGTLLFEWNNGDTIA